MKMIEPFFAGEDWAELRRYCTDLPATYEEWKEQYHERKRSTWNDHANILTGAPITPGDILEQKNKGYTITLQVLYDIALQKHQAGEPNASNND